MKCLAEHQNKFNDKLAFRDFVIGLEAWVPKSMMILSTGSPWATVAGDKTKDALGEDGLRPFIALLLIKIGPIHPLGFIEVINVPCT